MSLVSQTLSMFSNWIHRSGSNTSSPQGQLNRDSEPTEEQFLIGESRVLIFLTSSANGIDSEQKYEEKFKKGRTEKGRRTRIEGQKGVRILGLQGDKGLMNGGPK